MVCKGTARPLPPCRGPRLHTLATQACAAAQVVVGHAPTLQAGDQHWAALVAWAKQAGCLVPLARLQL